MLITTMCLWDMWTNMFHLPCEICAITGLRLTRETIEPLTKTKTNLGFTFNITAYNSFVEDHQGSIDQVDDQEHIAFLT